MIYEGSPAKHLSGLAALIVKQLTANKRCLYLNSPPMVAGIRSYLAATGLDVAAEVDRGALVLSSDDGHLVNNRFDGARMLALLADAVDQALKDGYEGLWAAGGMTSEFGPEKNFSKLGEYERGLEELFQKQPALQGICQSMSTLCRSKRSRRHSIRTELPASTKRCLGSIPALCRRIP